MTGFWDEPNSASTPPPPDQSTPSAPADPPTPNPPDGPTTESSQEPAPSSFWGATRTPTVEPPVDDDAPGGVDRRWVTEPTGARARAEARSSSLPKKPALTSRRQLRSLADDAVSPPSSGYLFFLGLLGAVAVITAWLATAGHESARVVSDMWGAAVLVGSLCGFAVTILSLWLVLVAFHHKWALLQRRAATGILVGLALVAATLEGTNLYTSSHHLRGASLVARLTTEWSLVRVVAGAVLLAFLYSALHVPDRTAHDYYTVRTRFMRRYAPLRLLGRLTLVGWPVMVIVTGVFLFGSALIPLKYHAPPAKFALAVPLGSAYNFGTESSDPYQLTLQSVSDTTVGVGAAAQPALAMRWELCAGTDAITHFTGSSEVLTLGSHLYPKDPLGQFTLAPFGPVTLYSGQCVTAIVRAPIEADGLSGADADPSYVVLGHHPNAVGFILYPFSPLASTLQTTAS